MAHTGPISIDNMSSDTPVHSNSEETQQPSSPLAENHIDNSVPQTSELDNTKTEDENSICDFDVSYKGDALIQRVSSILGLSDYHGWSIVDTHENLALVHYNDDADMTIYGGLRGVLVDTEVGVVIAKSFGYTPTVISDRLTSTDGAITVTDTEGDTHTFSTDDTIIKRVFEGVVFRVVWHKGKSYRLTHRKIVPLRSRWGSSPTFISMYEDAGGPTDEQLFDTTKPFSDSCYVFLVSHPSLLVGTRQNITCPYIICLAHYRMNIGRPAEEIASGLDNFDRIETITGKISEPFIHDPKTLSLQDANHHLKFGYYNEFETDDERQLTGEAVIMYRTINGEVADIVKVHSPSYEWRSTMRGNNPNIPNQFYSMLNLAYSDVNNCDNWSTFQKKFILLPLYDEQSLKDLFEQNQGILAIPSGPVTRKTYSTRDARIHLLWMNFVLSLPASMQRDGLNLLSQFRNDRNDVISWLQHLESTTKDIEDSELPNRVKGIISSSRRLARSRVESNTNYSSKGSYMSLNFLIKNTIRNLINKEKGPSLYGLVRDMKKSRQAEQV